MTYLTGKQFEQICVYRMKWEATRNRGTIKRNNISCAELYGRPELNRNLCDFTGTADGLPYLFDAKVCSSASFSLAEATLKRGQYDELCQFDGAAFLLLHFNPRKLKSGTVGESTWAFPVWSGHEFWQGYESCETRSIGVSDLHQFAIEVAWNPVCRSKKLSPDIVSAVGWLSRMKKREREYVA